MQVAARSRGADPMLGLLQTHADTRGRMMALDTSPFVKTKQLN